MAEREKKKSGGSWQWLGPESNRHYLHYCIVMKTEWKADADHLLPSLPTSLCTLILLWNFWGMSGEKKMYGKEQWLGPESNRLCLHY
jgi:hypothetical protein